MTELAWAKMQLRSEEIYIESLGGIGDLFTKPDKFLDWKLKVAMQRVKEHKQEIKRLEREEARLHKT